MSAGPILLCYDGSEPAALAVDRAGALFPGAPAVVLCVWQPVGEFGPGNPLGAYLEALQRPPAELDRIGADIAAETAAAGVERARAAGLVAEALVQRSDADIWEAIVEAADERDARTIVLGTRHLTPARAVILGSVTYGVVHHSPRPVLVVPATRAS